MRCELITGLYNSFLRLNHSHAKKTLFLLFQKQLHNCSTVLLKQKSAWGTNKQHRNKKLYFKEISMADPAIESILAPLRVNVKNQGDHVRQLKAAGAPELDIKKAVADLKTKKKLLEDRELQLIPASAYFDRAKMEDLLKRRFFYDQSFSIYGGITGQYDFGPMGCAIKTNLLNAWRTFFVLEEQMLEVDCSILTPEPVLKASGHVDRFADLMVKDTVNGECFRLDHLIKSHLEKIISDTNTSNDKKTECETVLIMLDGFNKAELQNILVKYDIKAPITGNKLSEPIEFNLMFGTQIGPTGIIKGYLRPETAQGIFVNFKRLLEFNQGRLPFAAAQIGNAFRNEISPRSSLLRVREFTMAEIEHFCDPDNKSHPKFSSVAHQQMLLYSACDQMSGKSAQKLTIGEAVNMEMVNNETLGYFMARIYQFLVSIGIENKRLRFRQHMSNEMAHYATDCWDAECLTSYGWIECVGCADRSAYDLKQHCKATGVRLAAEKRLKFPKVEDVTKALPEKSVIGKTFKQSAKLIYDKLNSLSIDEVFTLQNQLNQDEKYNLDIDGQKFELTKEMVTIKSFTETKHVEEIIPNVIEPSFGIGRIMYALFEQNFRIREGDENRTYFSLPPIIAPLKCSVLPLSNNEEFTPFVEIISKELKKKGVPHKVDDSSGTIGRRYTRTDEIAIPFGITIDFDSLKSPQTVTVRERDSTEQLRVPVTHIGDLIKQLVEGSITWSNAELQYPKFKEQENKK